MQQLRLAFDLTAFFQEQVSKLISSQWIIVVLGDCLEFYNGLQYNEVPNIEIPYIAILLHSTGTSSLYALRFYI